MEDMLARGKRFDEEPEASEDPEREWATHAQEIDPEGVRGNEQGTTGDRIRY
jgi:hypothetical protein